MSSDRERQLNNHSFVALEVHHGPTDDWQHVIYRRRSKDGTEYRVEGGREVAGWPKSNEALAGAWGQGTLKAGVSVRRQMAAHSSGGLFEGTPKEVEGRISRLTFPAPPGSKVRETLDRVLDDPQSHESKMFGTSTARHSNPSTGYSSASFKTDYGPRGDCVTAVSTLLAMDDKRMEGHGYGSNVKTRAANLDRTLTEVRESDLFPPEDC